MSRSASSTRDILFLDNGGYNIKALYLPNAVLTQKLNSSVLTSTFTESPSICTLSSIISQHYIVVPNCVGAASYAGRGIIGSQLHQLPHYHGLMVRRPVSGVSGFIVDGVLQAHVWEYILQHFSIEDEDKVELWLTIPFGVTKAVAALLTVLLTQHFHFYSVTFVSTSFLCLISYEYHMSITSDEAYVTCNENENHELYQKNKSMKTVNKDPKNYHSRSHQHKRRRKDSNLTSDGTEFLSSLRSASQVGYFYGNGIVVDAGFSSTTIVPYINYCPVYSSIVRNEIGGKVLTNRLKEYLSYTQVNLTEDGWLVNHIKEQCCAVAHNPRGMLLNYDVYAQRNCHVLHDCAATLYDDTPSPETKNVSLESTYSWNASDSSTSFNDDISVKSSIVNMENSATAVVYVLPTVPSLYPLGFIASASTVPQIRLAMRAVRDSESVSADDYSSDDDDDDNINESNNDKDRSNCCSDNSVTDNNDCMPNQQNKRKDRICTLNDKTVLHTLLATQRNISNLQVVRLSHERFLIPELIFAPADIGVSSSSGLIHGITDICGRRGLLKYLPLVRSMLPSQVYIYGGSSQFPGFFPRMQMELQAMSSDDSGHPNTITARKKITRFLRPPNHGLKLKNDINFSKHEVANISISTFDNITNISGSHSVSSAELQPLLGAYILLTQTCAIPHREKIEQRSRVQLASIRYTRALDEVMYSAMQNIL